MTVVNVSAVERRLSPANSFTPDVAFLMVGHVRLDLDDPDVCDELAEQFRHAAASLRRTHGGVQVGGRD